MQKIDRKFFSRDLIIIWPIESPRQVDTTHAVFKNSRSDLVEKKIEKELKIWIFSVFYKIIPFSSVKSKNKFDFDSGINYAEFKKLIFYSLDLIWSLKSSILN